MAPVDVILVEAADAFHRGRVVSMKPNALIALHAPSTSVVQGGRAGLVERSPTWRRVVQIPSIDNVFAVFAAYTSLTFLLLAMQANVKAKFQYQRTTFPQISGDGSAYVESVGGHAKLGIRVANDGAGRPLVCLKSCDQGYHSHPKQWACTACMNYQS